MAFQSTLPRGERHEEGYIAGATEQFQSTLPRGERPYLSALQASIPSVSIHAPARGATTTFIFGIAPSSFQSTLPRGERRMSLSSRTRNGCFNPRSRAGSDATRGNRASRGRRRFNPRSRAGSDSARDDVDSRHVVSIHAPARGATHRDLSLRVVLAFQSTLPRGERLRSSADLTKEEMFQSTLPRGERRYVP